MIYPKHIWFIPDWNRTWADKNGFPKFVWHLEWFNVLVEIWKYVFSNTDVKVFSAWWLSTENLKWRSPEELEYLFELYKKIPSDLYDFLNENKINFRWVWKRDWLPNTLVDFLDEKQKTISFWTDRTIVMAINYWWRDEIIRWINKLQENDDFKNWDLKIDENIFSKYLDFWDLPAIDLLIRTKWSMAKRLSWFMLWWVWYAELYFTEKLCPEFTSEDMDKALEWFNNIYWERNFWK